MQKTTQEYWTTTGNNSDLSLWENEIDPFPLLSLTELPVNSTNVALLPNDKGKIFQNFSGTHEESIILLCNKKPLNFENFLKAREGNCLVKKYTERQQLRTIPPLSNSIFWSGTQANFRSDFFFKI